MQAEHHLSTQGDYLNNQGMFCVLFMLSHTTKLFCIISLLNSRMSRPPIDLEAIPLHSWPLFTKFSMDAYVVWDGKLVCLESGPTHQPGGKP